MDAIDLYELTDSAKLDQVFDCAAIGDFNILPTAPPRINHLEVATLLMGTAGCMTGKQ